MDCINRNQSAAQGQGQLASQNLSCVLPVARDDRVEVGECIERAHGCGNGLDIAVVEPGARPPLGSAARTIGDQLPASPGLPGRSGLDLADSRLSCVLTLA